MSFPGWREQLPQLRVRVGQHVEDRSLRMNGPWLDPQ
jgi:hypothetical protein